MTLPRCARRDLQRDAPVPGAAARAGSPRIVVVGRPLYPELV